MFLRKEIESSLVLVSFGLAFLFYTTRYPLGDWLMPGPAVFPLIVGSVLTLLALGQLVVALYQRIRRPAAETWDKRVPLREFFRRQPGELRVILMVVFFVLHLVLFPWVGFFVCTFFFIIATSRMAAQDWRGSLILAVLLSLFCYLLFEVWLVLSLPRGILF